MNLLFKIGQGRPEMQEFWKWIVSDFYLFFGTDGYNEVREPSFVGTWICKSIEWECFDTYKEAAEALNKIGKDVV